MCMSVSVCVCVCVHACISLLKIIVKENLETFPNIFQIYQPLEYGFGHEIVFSHITRECLKTTCIVNKNENYTLTKLL